jgi:single-strand DNA-binding protein
MAALNKVMLIGYVGQNPEISSFEKQSEALVVRFSVATTDKWKDSTTQENRSKTEWHNISAFGKLAQVCSLYLTKGSMVYVEGKLETREWQDKKTGMSRKATAIIASTVQFLSTKDAQKTQATYDDVPF